MKTICKIENKNEIVF